MKELDIERAWKDKDYFNSLSPEDQAQIPPDPAGSAELASQDLDSVAGGITVGGTCGMGSAGCITTECPTQSGPDCGCGCEELS